MILTDEFNISDLLNKIVIEKNNLSNEYITYLLPIAWYFANIKSNQKELKDLIIPINLSNSEFDKCIKIKHNPHIDIIIPFNQINLTIELNNQNYHNIDIAGPCSMYQIKKYISKYSLEYKCDVLKCNITSNEITIIFYH